MEIEKGEAELLLKRARADRDHATAEIAHLETLKAQAAGLDKLIEGLELMFPSLAVIPAVTSTASDAEASASASTLTFGSLPKIRRSAAPAGPAATDSARMILREKPATWFTGRDMIDEFEARHLPGTPTAIRLALKRLAERGFADLRTAEDGAQNFRLHAETDPGKSEVSTS